MFKQKLLALGHPSPDTFNYEDEKEYRSTVLWLEDQKIRHYTIEDREGLRNIDSEEWPNAFVKYQKDLMSPCMDGNRLEQLHWVMAFAVRLEYSDNAAKYKAAKLEEPKRSAPNMVTLNTLDHLDVDSPAFKAGVERICALTGVGPHPDHKVRLAALAKVLKTGPHPDPTSIELLNVAQPTDVFKLLFLQDIRDLQTKINETLVAVQKVTADPRTDTTLGRVGR